MGWPGTRSQPEEDVENTVFEDISWELWVIKGSLVTHTWLPEGWAWHLFILKDEMTIVPHPPPHAHPLRRVAKLSRDPSVFHPGVS